MIDLLVDFAEYHLGSIIHNVTRDTTCRLLVSTNVDALALGNLEKVSISG